MLRVCVHVWTQPLKWEIGVGGGVKIARKANVFEVAENTKNTKKRYKKSGSRGKSATLNPRDNVFHLSRVIFYHLYPSLESKNAC